MDCSQPGSSVHEDSPDKNTGLPFPSPGALPNPGIEPGSPALQADCLPTELLMRGIMKLKQKLAMKKKTHTRDQIRIWNV